MALASSPNVQVSFDSDPKNDRSESSLATNPRDSNNMIGASKKFTNPATYEFSLAAYASVDGGQSWKEAPALVLPPTVLGERVDGISDPTVAFDDQGTAYQLGLAFHNGPPGTTGDLLGMVLYTSTDKGATWSAPRVIHEGNGDDKQDLASDLSGGHHNGNVYATWDLGGGVVFARTTDHGATWQGVNGRPTGSLIMPGANFSAITVDSTGQVFVFADGANPISGVPAILYVTSTDGGDSFSGVQIAVSGITPLDANVLSAPNGFAELPGGTFRVDTFPAVSAGSQGALVVVWADYREGVSRVYARRSTDRGVTWTGPGSGARLLTGGSVSGRKLHDFHPQLTTAPNGQIGCAFYEFGPIPTANLINVVLAASNDNGATFSERVTVTDKPWDPTVDAPLSHGDKRTTFIGDYFGLAASPLGFFPFWTDTRTGIQEIFTARVHEA